MIDEISGRNAYYVEECTYCKKKVSQDSVKASKKKDKINRYVICKRCWSDLNARTQWKRA
ncbi:MAG TPA: hypothetical protein PLO51_03390 [Candidatus Micrarchaeota archaeon]|nr:hypothetical protein [Candidatus Micrarchaeota archaeon]